MGNKHKNFSINVHELLGKCVHDCEWKSQCEVQTCTIHGMTEEMLDGILGVINDDVSCSDYIKGRLVLGKGTLARLQLTKIGYAYDAHISVDATGVLKVSIPHDRQRQMITA